MLNVLKDGITPDKVVFLFSGEELCEKAKKVINEETGLNVNVTFDYEGENFYLELHNNDEETIDKLLEHEYNVYAPAEDTDYLISKIMGTDEISFCFDEDEQVVEVRVDFEVYQTFLEQINNQ